MFIVNCLIVITLLVWNVPEKKSTASGPRDGADLESEDDEDYTVTWLYMLKTNISCLSFHKNVLLYIILK